ncbi:MAG: hypothetical protein LBQ64_03100, partial [Bacteroidales bacterium]|nr:hypothetical protein [Bacteroidales bacterium]
YTREIEKYIREIEKYTREIEKYIREIEKYTREIENGITVQDNPRRFAPFSIFNFQLIYAIFAENYIYSICLNLRICMFTLTIPF